MRRRSCRRSPVRTFHPAPPAPVLSSPPRQRPSKSKQSILTARSIRGMPEMLTKWSTFPPKFLADGTEPFGEVVAGV